MRTGPAQYNVKNILPDTPQYNGVAERALGLLQEKAIALTEEFDNVIRAAREVVGSGDAICV